MISVIVNFFNNQREAKNTLFSLSRMYQRHVDQTDYEVICLDHGSSMPLSEIEIFALGKEFKYRFIEGAPVSPVQAINSACNEALGDYLIIMIDGAHLVTPNILKLNQDARAIFNHPFVVTPTMHLGPKMQNQSVLEGYDQAQEDQLLQSIQWKENGYRLFQISAAFSDAGFGWFGNLFESGCFGINKQDYFRLGGLNEKFISPGGGLVNLDFFKKALTDPGLNYVMLLGEASFHQFHGGIASNASAHNHPWKKFHDEYVKIYGKNFNRAIKKPYFLGSMQLEAINAMNLSLKKSKQFWEESSQNKVQGK